MRFLISLFSLVLLKPCFAATLVWVGPYKDPTTESLLMSLAQYEIKLVHVIPNRKLNSLKEILKDLNKQLSKHTEFETAIAYAGYRQDGFLAYLMHENSPNPDKTFALGSFSTAMELVRLGMDSIHDPHTRNNYKRSWAVMRNFSAPYLNVLSKLINTVRVTYIDPLILGHHYSGNRIVTLLCP